jgi:hypothetical protein
MRPGIVLDSPIARPDGGKEHTIKALKSVLALLAVPLVFAGCGLLPHKVIEVDPVALREISSIGTVVGQATIDPLYENTVQVINLLIMDVDASSFEEASARARGLLKERGWIVLSENLDTIKMESSEWEFIRVTIEPLEDLEGYGSKAAAKIKDVVKSNSPKSDAYILIDVTPYRY